MVRGNDTTLFAGLYEEDFHGTLGNYQFLDWTGSQYVPDANNTNKFSLKEKDPAKGVFVLTLLKDTFFFRDTISDVLKRKDGIWLITQVGEYDVPFEMNYRISATDSPSVSQLDIPALGTKWYMRKE